MEFCVFQLGSYPPVWYNRALCSASPFVSKRLHHLSGLSCGTTISHVSFRRTRHHRAKGPSVTPPPKHSLAWRLPPSPICIVHLLRRLSAPKEARSAELREKFETAVPSIQEKLKVEAERRQQQRLDNEELRGKLVSFAEQAKLRCARVAPHTLRGLKGRAPGGGLVLGILCAWLWVFTSDESLCPEPFRDTSSAIHFSSCTNTDSPVVQVLVDRIRHTFDSSAAREG